MSKVNRVLPALILWGLSVVSPHPDKAIFLTGGWLCYLLGRIWFAIEERGQ